MNSGTEIPMTEVIVCKVVTKVCRDKHLPMFDAELAHGDTWLGYPILGRSGHGLPNMPC